MVTTLRIDDDLKRDCDLVLNDMGLNLSCAITIFLKELTRRRAMPFVPRARGACDTETPLRDRYVTKQYNADLAECGRRAEKLFSAIRPSNNREWTLDEINAEIDAARAARRAKGRARR